MLYSFLNFPWIEHDQACESVTSSMGNLVMETIVRFV